jgi:hypothetical protein
VASSCCTLSTDPGLIVAHGGLDREHHLARSGRPPHGQLEGRGDGVVGKGERQPMPDSGFGMRCSIDVAPPPGCSPNFLKRASNNAPGPAMRTSAANARFRPPPTAAIVGSRQLADSDKAVVDPPQPGLRPSATGGAQGAEVRAGAKRLARARDHDGVHVGIGLGPLHGITQGAPTSHR